MIVEKLIMPYVLASHHVTIHIAMLLTLITQIIIDKNLQEPQNNSWLFPTETKDVSDCYLYFLIIHSFIIFIEFISQWLKFSQENHQKNGKNLTGDYINVMKFLDLFKVSLVFWATCYGQAIVTKGDQVGDKFVKKKLK